MDVMDLRRRLMMGMAANLVMAEIGSYTPAEDVASYSTAISHSLGVVPDFVYAYAEGIDPSTSSIGTIVMGCVGIRDYVGKLKTGFGTYNIVNGSGGINTNYEAVDYTKFCSESNFHIPYYNSGHKLKGGVTYRYIVGKLREGQ